MKHLIIRLLLGAIFSLMLNPVAFAHGGVDHNNSCFLTVGDSRLRISGYQFQSELEGKHFCHFFPELGQIVLAIEPMTGGQDMTLVTLELAALTLSTNPAQAFTVIKQQPEQLLNSGLVSISQSIQQRGIYKLNVTLQKVDGSSQQQSLMFLVGVPVTKIMVMIALAMLLLLGFIALSGIKKQG